MVDKTETLEILNKEKTYEDQLVLNLSNYFIASLNSIKDINEQEKKKIKEYLEQIGRESEGHSYVFKMLIQKVLEHGENNY